MSTYRIEYVETAGWRIDIKAADADEARTLFWDLLGGHNEAVEIGVINTEIDTITEITERR